MSTPKIPKGWRKLRVGTLRKEGDKHYHANGAGGPSWEEVSVEFGKIDAQDMRLRGAYIRRKASRTGATQARAKVGGKAK